MILKLYIIYYPMIFTFGLMACGGSNSRNSAEITGFPEGRNLYVSKCTACHKAYEPQLHTIYEWQKILDDMGPKAKLSNDEKTIILNYLSARD